MNTMNSNQLADFLMAVTAVADGFQAEFGETASETYILHHVVATLDNCVDELTNVELVLTATGWGLRFDEADVTEAQIDGWLARALTMAQEDLYEAQAD